MVAEIERAVGARDAGVLWVDARVLRRVIKRHRKQAGLGLSVPHTRCYALSRGALASVVTGTDVGTNIESLSESIVLLPRITELGELSASRRAELIRDQWRYLFHARVHTHFEALVRAGSLSGALVRERVHRIGQTEFDEIRIVLKHDNHLLPHSDAIDTYVEFAALYSELSFFDPKRLREVFSDAAMRAVAEGAIALDLDAPKVLDATKPDGAADPGYATEAGAGRQMSDDTAGAPATRSQSSGAQWAAAAAAMRQRGNDVRAMLALLERGVEADVPLRSLAERLVAVAGGDPVAWVAVLRSLGEAAAVSKRGTQALGVRGVEARLLYDLQKACTETEREVFGVDLVRFVLTLGRARVVRALPAAREVRIARHLQSAAKRASRVRLAASDVATLTRALHQAVEHADAHVRVALRPRLTATLDEVGLVATNVPEEVARAKLVEELLDGLISRGFLTLSHLRDAISQNDLKLSNLSGVREFFIGDSLLRADRRLTFELDGVYRGGEIYLRGLQKLSSLVLGTAVGRFLTMFLILPVVASFVLLEGLQHMVGPLVFHLTGVKLHLVGAISFACTAAFVFGLINSGAVRRASGAGLRLLGRGLHAVFIGAPRWLFSRSLVRRLFSSRAMRFVATYLLKPAVLTFCVLPFVPLLEIPVDVAWPLAAIVFLSLDLFLATPAGIALQEAVVDGIVRAVRQVGNRILPGAVQVILQFFGLLVEGLERLIYMVDELLRFRKGQRRGWIPVRAILGLVWFALTYLIRIYINLLVEPQINPIKHFPVVTVSHKIILPLSPTLIEICRAPLMPFGSVVANSFAATTVLLLPGVFGFLAWEFKENWRLYRAKNRIALKPVIVGHHGETLARLLRPGFHSGTVPKLFVKIRRARLRNDPALAKYEEAMHHAMEAVKRFVERECASLLEHDADWTGGAVVVSRVESGSNRIRVAMHAPRVSAEPAWIQFEEQSGWILGSLVVRGFVAALGDVDRALFVTALGGLYRKSAVDWVREQLSVAIGAGSIPYDISDEGLIVWPGEGFRTEVVYDLSANGDLVVPMIRGDAAAADVNIAPIDLARVRFQRVPIAWGEWVGAWRGKAAPALEAPRREPFHNAALPLF